MNRVSVDLKDVARLARDMDTFGKKALPYAVSNGCNTMAFDARKVWTAQIQKSMVLRNRWTLGSMRVERARPIADLQAIHSTLGSVAAYMAAQEGGLAHQMGGKRAIPTSAAAGQKGARPRTRVVRRASMLSSGRIAERPHSGSRAQRNAIAIRRAREQKAAFTYLELANGNRGFFRVTARTITMLWDLAHGSPRIPPNPTLENTVVIMQGRAVRIFYDSLVDQAWRARVFRGRK